MSSTDQTFITNEAGQTLAERFGVLIRNTRAFDVLVGYFYTSGFYKIYESLESAEKIRILVGISTDKKAADMLARARQQELQFSHAEIGEKFAEKVIGEMESSEDTREVEEGVAKFIEWLQNGKLKIKAHPTRRLHAKLYIMTFVEEDRDVGRVITGSSNFTESGLVDNLEFNVELKGRADYDFAKAKFEELWAQGVDVKERYIETIENETWLNEEISPYELYLKFLYEYFKDELDREDSSGSEYAPPGFLKLKYQSEAVFNAKRIVEEYGGVFLSDVVGLGKTYMAVMLVRELGGRTLVVAPPALLDENNPGSWRRAFSDFNVAVSCRSFGKLDQIISSADEYHNVIIDEAHRFRSETNVTYEKIAQICRGKRVILVTATPFNNSPHDILSEIKLFQPGKQSSIPNLSNLEGFFGELASDLNQYDRQTDRQHYLDQAAENARRIREDVLKYLMVRRTRHEIQKYFGADLKAQGVAFPQVEDPKPAYYQLDKTEDELFDYTVEMITQRLNYARYMPMTYYEGDESVEDEQSQKNLGAFMKVLLIKRLESSFFAFQQTVGRFIKRNEEFLKAFGGGKVYVSKKYTDKIFDLLDSGDDDAIQRLIDGGRANYYKAADFSKKLKRDLESDLRILRQLQSSWSKIKRDPKLDAFIDMLKKDKTLAKNKIIVFTESRETGEYLSKKLQDGVSGGVLAFSGGATAAARAVVTANFDANVGARNKKDDYRVLVTTEVLSEGVNLHRANVVVNYDIPWNPTRMMQRVGRINRVDTEFDKIYTYNFFPTAQANSEIQLQNIAIAKIEMFIRLLGVDARLLTDSEEVKSFELFGRITSKAGITGEADEIDGELKYSEAIKNIRDNDKKLFARIESLPKKARTARRRKGENALLTYFRKGKLQKFFLAGEGPAKEIDFLSAAETLEVAPNTKRAKTPADFYDKLDANKDAFADITDGGLSATRGGRDPAHELLIALRALRNHRPTDKQKKRLNSVIARLEEGALPRQTVNTVLKPLRSELATTKSGMPNMQKIHVLLKKHIPGKLLEGHLAESVADDAHPSEVILSEYLVGS